MSAPQQYPQTPQQRPSRPQGAQQPQRIQQPQSVQNRQGVQNPSGVQNSQGAPNAQGAPNPQAAQNPQGSPNSNPQAPRVANAQPQQGLSGPVSQLPLNPNATGRYPQAPVPTATKPTPNGFAIAGLVMALIATFVVLVRYHTYLSPFGVIGLILSVLGYTVNRDDDGGTTSRTAQIFAFIGGILSIIAIIITLVTGFVDPESASSSLFL